MAGAGVTVWALDSSATSVNRQGRVVGSARGIEAHGAFLVSPDGGCQGRGGDEETCGRIRVDGGREPGFKPVVEIGDGQDEPGGIDRGEHMGDNR